MGYHNPVSTADKHLCGAECLRHCVCACLRSHMHVQGHVCAVSTSKLSSAEQADKLVAKENMHKKFLVDQRFSANIHNTCFGT